MTQANFKNVRVGQRFVYMMGVYVRLRNCTVHNERVNAVMIDDKLKSTNANTPSLYRQFGNVAVSILEDDEA